MKKALVFLFVLVANTVIAQTAPSHTPDTNLKTLDLEEVIVKGHKPDTYKKRIRPQYTHLVFNRSLDIRKCNRDSVYYLTKLPKLDDQPVKLYRVTCRLESFDTSLFTLQLVFFQANNGDTQLRVFPVRNTHEIRKRELVVDLSEEHLQITPGEFFLGYGYITKNFDRQFTYRLYTTAKGEPGIMIDFAEGYMRITSHPIRPNNFPFKVSYLRL